MSLSVEGIYTGRLKGDGNGNLLADESRLIGTQQLPVFDSTGTPVMVGGVQLMTAVPIYDFGENHDKPVTLHEGSYVYLNPGDLSHNQRYGTSVKETIPTQSELPDEPGYAGTIDDPIPGLEHHFAAVESDLHFSAGAPLNTRITNHPDSLAPNVSGSTQAYAPAQGEPDATNTP